MITYFVLKAEGGGTSGCVRLDNGKARSSCPCTLLLEDGSALSLNTEETPLPARPLGAAVLQGDRLSAWGSVPGAALTETELLHRLRRATAEELPKPAPEPDPEPAPEPVPEPETEPAPPPEPVSEPEPGPASDAEEPPGPTDSAARAADFGLLVRHATEVYDSILHPPFPEDAPPPPEETALPPAKDKGNWFSETEALLDRIRRR